MDIQITSQSASEYGTWLELTAGKTSASVMVYNEKGKDLGKLRVTCKNASHSCWRGVGKGFESVEAALENYRSAAMKGMIRAAVAAAGFETVKA